jgi:electron transport complex protein RnfC
MGLEPYLLATCSVKKMWDKVEAEEITSCIECGSCQFTCPSNRPLLDLVRMGKQTVMTNIRARQMAAKK